MQRLDVGGIGTEAVFGDDELEMGVILAQLGDEAFGGIALTIIFLRAILFDNGFGHQRNDFTAIRMEKRRPQQLVIIGDRPIAMDLVQTRGTVNRLRGKIPRAIEGHKIMVRQERPSLPAPCRAGVAERRAGTRGGATRANRIEALPHRTCRTGRGAMP